MYKLSSVDQRKEQMQLDTESHKKETIDNGWNIFSREKRINIEI